MERKGEWGDHMVLQGVSEVTHCRILVINSDLVKTELNPWHSTHDETQIDIVLLGHMGEYHYVSLRPSNWKETWAIRAKMKLMHELQNPHSSNQDLDDDQLSVLHTRETRTDVADKKSIPIDQDQTEDNHDRTQLKADDENLEQGNKETGVCDAQQTDKMSACSNESNAANNELDLSYIAFQNTELLQKSNNFKATEILFDTQEDLNRVVMEANFIDPLSGVPTQHLSFYLRQVLEPSEIYVDNKLNTLNYHVKTSARDQNVDVVVYGSVGERMVVSPHMCCHHNTIQPQILFYQSDVANIVYEAESAIGPHSLLADTNSCAPGNLTLQVPYIEYFESCKTEKIKETVYLCALNSEFTVTFCNQHIHPKITQGIECSQWPESLTSEWHTRERPSGFPDSEMMKELASRACYVRKYSNSSNQNSDIEWQFVFPTVETDLLRDMMNPNMKYALRLFKMITNFQTETVQRGLRTNHLKTVMLYSCESVPISVWSNNIGGGVLFLISSLMLYLHRRCLPHYIMASVNLLEEYSDFELDNLLMCLEQIRLFPLMALNVFAETNHLRNQWIIDPIVNDLHRFRNDRDNLKSIEQAFCPTLIELAKRLVMFGVHDFEKGFNMIERAYDSIYDLEKQRKVENPQTFEQFIEPFAYAVEDPITRYFFTDFVDSKLRTNILSKMVDSDHVRIVGDVGDREAGGKYNEFPIPDGSKLDDVEYLQSLANYLMTIDKKESAAHFFRCGITLGRCALKEEIIDVSEITDEEVKKQITEKNMKTTQNFHYTLYSLYNNLIDCYNHMKQTILFQEFIHDFEELVETLSYPCYFKKLAETWDALGNVEKADLYHGKADQHQHNKHSTRV
ncbi:unnamed protein product [Mytilus edulis]|uniref:Mab-21-like HhH/H2TH-like domain-containing protein n=1 Tax=Mytilus edulis TaxID=6550 RepID=A0A8S3V168_MYTED|nr:unnamed protein product [Mytilus edulis]